MFYGGSGLKEMGEALSFLRRMLVSVRGVMLAVFTHKMLHSGFLHRTRVKMNGTTYTLEGFLFQFTRSMSPMETLAMAQPREPMEMTM